MHYMTVCKEGELPMTYIHSQFDYTYPFSFPLSYPSINENTYLLTYNLCFTANDCTLKQGYFQCLKKQLTAVTNQSDLYITLTIPNPSLDIYITHLNNQNELIYVDYVPIKFNHNFNSLSKRIITNVKDNYIYTNLKQNLLQTLPIIFHKTRNNLPYVRGL